MKRMEIRTVGDLMKAANTIVDLSAKNPDTEVWHPSFAWGAPRFSREEWDEVNKHLPKPMAIRVVTPHRMVVVQNIWRAPEFMNTNAECGAHEEAYNCRLNLLVARAIKRLITRDFAVIDINIDWETVIPVVVSDEKVPRRRRRR